MRQNSVDGITNFDNLRDRFKFDTKHLRLVSVDKRAPLPTPQRRRKEIISTSSAADSNLKNPPVVPAERTVAKLPKSPDPPKESKQPEVTKTKTKKRFWQQKEGQRKLLLAMASIIFISGMAVTGYGIYINRQVAAVHPPSQEQDTSARTVADSDEQPSEEPISDQAIWSYEVPSDHPRLLMIPKLSITARAIELGVDEYGNLQTPYSVWDTGWYRDSAKPGSKYGATLIDGHVSGMWGIGVFSQLETLNQGDEIIIERGDRTHVKYKVVSKEIFKKDKVDMKKAIKSADLTKHGLNLITCNGKYIPEEKTFSHRLLVRAVEVD